MGSGLFHGGFCFHPLSRLPEKFIVGQTKKELFIKPTPENPVLWRGMKGVSAESRKKQMLKQVQHDMMVRFRSFCHPELVSGSQFWV